LAANATDAALHYLTRRFQLSQVASTVLAATLILLISILPAYKLIVHNIREAMPSTRVLAREWILHNLSTDSLIAQEWYTAPLEGTNFTITQSFSLAERSLDEYREAGYRYLVVSSGIYERYMAEPDRYRQEVTFYESLFNQGILLQQFDPSVTRGGPTIRIYELN
jgi:hypothetical protein